MNVLHFADLRTHVGHTIRCQLYSETPAKPAQVELHCDTCHVWLVALPDDGAELVTQYRCEECDEIATLTCSFCEARLCGEHMNEHGCTVPEQLVAEDSPTSTE